MQSRYQIIKADQAAAHLARLDRLADQLRKAALEKGVEITFFGSYAEGRVDERSDLDIAIPDDIPKSLRRDVEDVFERIAARQNISIDIVSRSTIQEISGILVP